MKSSRLTFHGVTCVCAGLVALPSQAETVAVYPFTGDSFASTDTSADTTASALSAQGLAWQFFGTVTPPAATPSLGANAAHLPGSLVTTAFLGFTVTADAGFTMDLDEVSFLFAAWNGGPVVDTLFQGNWALRSSLDFFGANLGTGSAGTGGTQTFGPVTVPLNGPQFDNLTTIQFRLYAFDNGALQGLLEFDNVSLVATVVPEPGGPALLLLGAAACAALRRRAVR